MRPHRWSLSGAWGAIPTTVENFRIGTRWLDGRRLEFGIEPEEGGRLKASRTPHLADSRGRLADASGNDVANCEDRLRDMLICGGDLQRDDGGRAFAFKLHQFIGQGRALFATLESADRREFSLEGQVQAGGGRIFVPIKFCRQCGQDYYHVLRTDTRVLAASYRYR